MPRSLSLNRPGQLVVLTSLALGCGNQDFLDEPVSADPIEVHAAADDACLPEVACSGSPATSPRSSWRHGFKSPLATLAGAPQHRSIDLIAAADSPQQLIRGELKYGTIDKSLEDEDVEIFACRAGLWQRLGVSTTDGEGRFTLVLSGAARLPVGRRQLYFSVLGDRSATSGLALVTPVSGQVAASDIDGTLTSSENAFPESLITGATVAAHDGAPEAFTALRGRCYHPVYVTARGRAFTASTRAWLAARGFPAGPLRLAPQLLTLPGEPTVAYKADILSEIQRSGVGTAFGIGNRGSDAQAYERVRVGNIYLKRPEYNGEIDPFILRGEATGVDSYRSLIPLFSGLPKAP